MHSNTIAIFYSPLASESYSFHSYNYRWTITLLSEYSRVSTSGTYSLDTGLVSHKLASRIMSTNHSFFITVIIPSPPYVTYLKSSLLNMLNTSIFKASCLFSSNSFLMTHFKTYLNTHACIKWEQQVQTNKLCTHSRHISINGEHACFTFC